MLCVGKECTVVGNQYFHSDESKSLYARHLSNQLWLRRANGSAIQEAGREYFLDLNYYVIHIGWELMVS